MSNKNQLRERLLQLPQNKVQELRNHFPSEKKATMVLGFKKDFELIENFNPDDCEHFELIALSKALGDAPGKLMQEYNIKSRIHPLLQELLINQCDEYA